MINLVGRWQGDGVASYPTITTTRYREVLIIAQQDDLPRLHYEQKTWHIVDGEEKVLHWETGFIRQNDDGTYEWVNAQNNGRVEVMTGTITEAEGTTTLQFETSTFANDPRMIAATRTLTVSGDELRYVQSMKTQSHGTVALHLEAHLKHD